MYNKIMFCWEVVEYVWHIEECEQKGNGSNSHCLMYD